MDLEEKVKQRLLYRGFSKDQLLNNRGVIGATIDETILAVFKNLAIHNQSNCADFKHELEVTEKLLAERQRVLDVIPECPVHGKCVPHAIKWIEEMKCRETVRRTSAEWIKELGYKIIDHDGWDRANFQYSFHEEKITFYEFSKRLSRSTIKVKSDFVHSFKQ